MDAAKINRILYRLCAGAAQLVSQGDSMVTAAIASRRAAQLYGLQVLDEGIQDKADNFTRFLLLSRYTSSLLKPEQLSRIKDNGLQGAKFYITCTVQRSIGDHCGRLQATPIQDISCF